jgi:hypothetical protein
MTPERREAMLFQFGFPGIAYLSGGRSDCGELDDLWSGLLSSTGGQVTWVNNLRAHSGESCARSGLTGCTNLCGP